MLNLNPHHSTPTRNSTAKQRGQVIIEYVLLLVVAMALATTIMRTVVNRSPDSPGFLMKRWQGLLVQIGKDDPNQRGNK